LVPTLVIGAKQLQLRVLYYKVEADVSNPTKRRPDDHTQGALKQGIESTRHLTWTHAHIHMCETQVEVVRIFLRMEIKNKTGDAGSYHHKLHECKK
jgi:hypothetical protein